MNDVNVRGFDEASNKKLRFKDLFCYGSSDYCYQMMTFSLSTYLMIYCTDTLGIKAASISVLLLVVRIFDALNDPFIGTWIDKRRPDKKGAKYLKWILIGGLALCIMTSAIFMAGPQWSVGIKLLWLYITYIAASICSTVLFCSQMSLVARISSNTVERGKALGMLIVFANVSMILMAYIMDPFVGRGTSQGYMIGFWILAATCVPFLLFTFFGSKEVVKIDHTEYTQKLGMKTEFKMLFHNYQAWVPPICFVIFVGGFNMRIASAMYYFTYILGDASGFVIYTLATSIVGILTAYFLSGPAIKLCGGKGKLGVWCMLTCGILEVLQFFLRDAGFVIFMILCCLIYIPLSIFMGLVHSMMPDVADYCELRSGLRADAFLASMGTLGLKIGNAWGPAFVGLGLTIINYQAGAVLSAQGVNWMNYMFSLFPGILCFITMFVMMTYKINLKEHDKIREKLVEKYSLPPQEREAFRYDIKEMKKART